MDYLKAAIALRKQIEKSNKDLPKHLSVAVKGRHIMYLSCKDGTEHVFEMKAYTNAYVNEILKKYDCVEMFVITDRATTVQKDAEIHYYLLKGYHTSLEKGLVFFQPINKEDASPIGDLQFSNIEDNIFLPVPEHKVEESSCNAMETDDSTTAHRKIVFFIGNLDEERLYLDLQRLVYDTLYNVQLHSQLKFNFIIEISVFEGQASTTFKEQVVALEHFINEEYIHLHPNSTINFTWS